MKIEKLPVEVEQLSDREKVVYFAIIQGIPLTQVARHVEWSASKLKNTYRVLVWYLRYCFYYKQYRDYIREKLEEILVVEKEGRRSEWGKRLVFEMAEFPIRPTGYWAQKMGYELQGSVSGSVLVALFVAEDRIEAYLSQHREDTLLRRWYLLFRAVQFGFLDFNRRFRYKSHLFDDLPEWEYVRKELSGKHIVRMLKAEVRRLLNRGVAKDEIVRHLQENYEVEADTTEKIIDELLDVNLEERIKKLWSESKNFKEVCSKVKELGFSLSKSKITNILLGGRKEALVMGWLEEGNTTDDILKRLLQEYGATITLAEVYRCKKKLEDTPTARLARLLKEGVSPKELVKEYHARFGGTVSQSLVYKVVKKYGETTTQTGKTS